MWHAPDAFHRLVAPALARHTWGPLAAPSQALGMGLASRSAGFFVLSRLCSAGGATGRKQEGACLGASLPQLS